MGLQQLDVVFDVSPDRIDTITIDATIMEKHLHKVEVTRHPVEQGAKIADHARPEPVILVIEGVVSNTPIADSLRKNDDGSAKQFPQAQPGRADTAWDQLVDLKENPRLIDVAAQRQIFYNMVLTDLEQTRDIGTGESVHFVATFTPIVIVQNKVAALRTAKPNGKKKAKVGKAQVQPADTVRNSLAVDGLKTFGVLK